MVGLAAAAAAGVINLSVDPALEAAIKRREEERNEARVKGLVNLLQQVEITRDHLVSIRTRARQQLNESQQKIKDFHRSVDYFNETGNPFPLLRSVGVYRDLARFLPSDMVTKYDSLSVTEQGKLDEIPDNWQPKSSLPDPEVTAE